MFGKESKTEKEHKTLAGPLKDVCNVAAGTVIEGTVKVESHMRLEGKIIGNIKCVGRLVMSKTGHVEGNVICADLISEGAIVGNVSAQNKVHLMATANLEGDLACSKLQIEEGAIFNGKCSMEK